jgi:hypothetical protein
MGTINMAKVVVGGLLAGLVINVSEFLLNGVVFAEDIRAAMEALGKSPEMGTQQTAVWIVYGFVLGILAVWVYAAVRPRFGAGPKTAAMAGVVVWALAYLLPSVGYWNMGLFPVNFLVISCVWGLVELVVATVAGAWAYKES